MAAAPPLPHSYTWGHGDRETAGHRQSKTARRCCPHPDFFPEKRAMLYRTDKSFPYYNPSWSRRDLEAPPKPLAGNPSVCQGLLSPGPTAGAGTRPADFSGPFHTSIGTQAVPLSHGNGWQTSNTVSRAVQGRAAQISRAGGCSFLHSPLPWRWTAQHKWYQMMKRA